MARIPYVFLLAEVVAFYWKILFQPGRYVIPWDLRYYHLSIAHFMARSFERGELPLWDPYTYCGFPIYANLTAGLFYPPMVLSLLVSNWTGGGHLLYFLELQVVGHVFLAGVFTYRLLGRLSVGRAGALAGATVFQLGAFFASQSQHLGAVSAAAWMPLAWLAVIDLTEGFRWRPLALLSFALAMSILAGFPAVTAFVFASCLLLGGLLMIAGHAPLRSAVALSMACLWAVWLASAQLLPTLELTRQSVAALRSEWMGTGGGIPVQALVSMVIPNYWGVFQFDPATYKLPWNPTFLYLYCGIPGLLLALWAAVRRAPKAGVFAWMAAVAAVLMLGDQTPLGRAVFPRLPELLRSALYPEFAMAAFVLGVAVLAGLGAQALLEGRRAGWKIAVVAFVAVDLIAVSSGRRINTSRLDQEAGIGYNHFGPFADIPATLRKLVNQTLPPARIDTREGSIFWTVGAPLFEIPSANGNDPFALVRLMQVRLAFCKGERWGRYYEVSDPDSPVLDRLNVRYLISNTKLELGPKYRHVADLHGQQVYENTRVLPRFRLVAGTRELPPVKVLDYTPRGLALETDSPVAAELVTSETYYPGWHASIDGRETLIHLTGGAFRGLNVPAGRRRVEMWFAPSILWRSCALAAAGWLALAAVWLISRRPAGGLARQSRR